MQSRTVLRAVCIALFGSWIFVAVVAAQTRGAFLQAKKDAEARGFIFASSHDEIVARAKREGKLVVHSSQDAVAIEAATKAFNRKYPFIDVNASEISGTDTYLRMIGELKIGKITDWDVNYVAFDYYDDYLPHQKKFDLLGMAKAGVLKMPPAMIDPINRHIVALQTNMQALAYNKKLVSKDKVPTTFEDLLKPEFKGKKFALDIRPRAIAALVPAWGLEKTLTYAKQLSAQDPVWARGDSRTLPYISGGEVPMVLGLNYKSYWRFKKKDVQDALDARVIEPVPVRLTEAEGISATAQNPYAALLWLEFQASPEGQAILDATDLAASHLTSGSFHEKALRGKQLSVIGWKDYLHMENYLKEVVKAFGFPRTDR